VKSWRTRQFKVLFEQLPRHTKSAARKAYRLWLKDARHPSLR